MTKGKKMTKGIKMKGTRRSVSGKIDVRSNKDLPNFIKALKNKNLSLIFVYAPWCPHCHTMMPHFNKAAQHSNNTITPIAVKDTMLDAVNETIKNNVNNNATPLSVKGYPSLLVVDKQGNVVTPIRPDPSKLGQIMQIPDKPDGNGSSGNGNGNGNSTSQNIQYVKNNKNLLRNLGAENITETETETESESEPEPIKNRNTESLDVDKSISYTNPNSSAKPNSSEAEEIISMQGSTPFVPVKLPIESRGVVGGMRGMRGGNCGSYGSCGMTGGSLMNAMLKSGYTIAPAAVLLAAAAGIMTRKNKKQKKQKKQMKQKKSRKNKRYK